MTVSNMDLHNSELDVSAEQGIASDESDGDQTLRIGSQISEEELVVVESFLLPQILEIIRGK